MSNIRQDDGFPKHVSAASMIFGASGCTCPSTLDKLHASVSGVEPEPVACEMHPADAQPQSPLNRHPIGSAELTTALARRLGADVHDPTTD